MCVNVFCNRVVSFASNSYQTIDALSTSFSPLFITDKTIKLWRITERCRRVANSTCTSSDYFLHNNTTRSTNTTDNDDNLMLNDKNNSSVSLNKIYQKTDLRVPYYEDIDPVMDAHPKRIFANAHTYLINSLSVNSDQETFLSADDLRINLWNLEITNQSFSILFFISYCLFNVR